MSAAVGVTNEVADHFERWVLEKRARSSRGLSARSEAGYRTDIGTFAKRVADRMGRDAPSVDPASYNDFGIVWRPAKISSAV